jgi:hypothetical protein
VPARRGGGRELARAQQRDLGAHERAVGGVVGDQPILAGVARRVAVGAHECLREARTAPKLEVHHEERELVRHVELAEGGIELDAVDDLRRAIQQDVLGAQVAVAVAHAPRLGAVVEHPCVRGRERVREALEREHPLGLRGLLQERQQFLRVPEDPAADGARVAAFRCHLGSAGVEAGEDLRERGDLGALELAALEPRRERGALVVAAHLDHIVDGARVVLIRERDPRPARGERAHAEIHVRRQAAAEPHLLVAHLAPALRRAVVEEGQHEGLLELVGAVAREGDPGDVGLAQLHPAGPARVERGPRERPARARSGSRVRCAPGGRAGAPAARARCTARPAVCAPAGAIRVLARAARAARGARGRAHGIKRRA